MSMVHTACGGGGGGWGVGGHAPGSGAQAVGCNAATSMGTPGALAGRPTPAAWPQTCTVRQMLVAARARLEDGAHAGYGGCLVALRPALHGLHEPLQHQSRVGREEGGAQGLRAGRQAQGTQGLSSVPQACLLCGLYE